jgi:hypothetical protein
MRTIESPGVEIREIDLSNVTELPVGTVTFAAGYTPQGPVDELINVTSLQEWEQIYGVPTNAAERYFYNTCKQILITRGSLMTTRIPYGSGSGDGFTNDYSALLFPVYAVPSDPEDYVTGTSGTAVSGVPLFDISNPGNRLYGEHSFYAANSASGFIYVDKDSLTMDFENVSIQYTDTGTVSSLSDMTFAVSGTNTNLLSCTNPNFYATVNYDFSNETAAIEILTTLNAYATGTSTIGYDWYTATGYSGIPLEQASSYYIGQPYHKTIDDDTYDQWLQGGIVWKNKTPNGTTPDQITALSGVGYSGFIIVNKARTTIDEQFAGYYVTIADNSKFTKGSNFDVISKAKSFNEYTSESEWVELNTDKLDFQLTGSFIKHAGSVSEIIENAPSFNFANDERDGYTDSVVISLFRLRPTQYNAEDRILGSVLSEVLMGSFDETRTIQNERGGQALNFYIEDIVNDNSRSMNMFVNPYMAKEDRTNAWFDPQTGEPLKRVRVKMAGRNNLIEGTTYGSSEPTDPAQPNNTDLALFNLGNGSSYISNGDSMYGVGEYVSCRTRSEKLIGELPRKLERALTLVENRELIRVDLMPEAGLGTIWTGMNLDMNNWPANATNSVTFNRVDEIFDDHVFVNGIHNPHAFDQDSEGLLDQKTGSASEASDLYETIYNIFNSFAMTVRQDLLYIADPLRYIFVQGPGVRKVLDNKNKNFPQHIYWPLKNLYGAANSSYACTYANWYKITDTVSGKFIWVPPSGYVSRLMIETDTNFFPWFAPAGLTRGIVRDVVDLGVNPIQRQRDMLYKIGINPTVYWPGDGYVIWGQKTLLQKPSAFNRINVRRLFLWLEKATLRIARYFVFEQNTIFTRERLKTALRPIFEFAKNNEGVYDYLIVSDERNNTPDVIDRNELVVDIYIKPVRVAEFILINFIATRTDANFEELI